MGRGVYARIIASRVRSQLAYPVSFALDVLSQLLGQGIELLAILVIFTQVTSLGGFTAGEVVLIYGLAATAFGLADLAVGQVEALPDYIRTGEFDVILLRPLGALPQLLSADVQLRRVGRVAVGLAALAWALRDVEWTPLRVAVAVVAPLAGAVLLSAIWIAANCVSFWLVDGREVANSVTYGSLAKRIGVVFGQRSQLWWDLPLCESFALHGAIHRVPYADRLDECVELLDMAEFLATPVRQLSLGQRMRGEVTAALLHRPELLVLDEPTIGLDLASKERLRAFLADLVARGAVTLLLTTHDLPDVERLCRRVVVIDRGRVLVDDELAALRARFGGAREVVVDLAEPASPLTGLPGVHDVTVEAGGLRQRLAFAPADTTAAAVIAAVAERAALRDVAVVEPSIEALVRTLYAG